MAAMQQYQPVPDAKSSNNNVYGFPYGDTLLPQIPIVHGTL
jgi:hypothetical protein